MPVAKITTQGLIAIALLVASLWGCILTESRITRSARLTAIASQHELDVLRSNLRNVNRPISPYSISPLRAS